MLEFPRWKIWIVTLVVLAGIFMSIPSLIAGTPYAKKGTACARGNCST